MEQVWWYATRAAGLMTWSAAVASVLVGLMLSARVIRSRTGPWVLDLHRFLGGLTLAFLLIHLVALWADSYVEFGWQELLVPGESQWRPQAVAWGVVSAWIIFAVEATSILRKHIGQTVWRVVHWASLLAVAGGTVHGIQAGSDVENPLIWAAAGAGALALIVLGSIRLRGSAPTKATRPPATETEILLEMRERLAALPVPDSRTGLEYVNDVTNPLPRREPAEERDAALPGGGALIDALGRAARAAQSDETFRALPVSRPVDDNGVWADPTPDHVTVTPEAIPLPDPGTATADLPVRRVGESSFAPGAADPRRPLAPRPFVDPATVRAPEPSMPDLAPDRPPDFSVSPFARAADSQPPAPPATRHQTPPPAPEPVTRTPEPPVAFERPPPEFQPASPPPEFETVAPSPSPPPTEPSAAPPIPEAPVTQPPPVVPEQLANPFSEIEPPTISLTAPAPLAHATVPAGPPPLPEHAIDPQTGEPDEGAYREWLVEWLQFAEQYGDEAPSDPTRF